jgi:hypothetical protein
MHANHSSRLVAIVLVFLVMSAAASVSGCGSSPQAKSPVRGAGTGATAGAAGSPDTSGASGAPAPNGGAGDGAAGASSGASGASGTSAGDTGVAGGAASAGASGAAGGDGGAGGAIGAAGSGAAGSVATMGTDGAGAPKKDFVCTELIGLWVASQWWSTFEKGVDGTKWEFMFQHHGYLEMFADPASPYWNNAVTSQCAMSPKTPDRIVFLPFSLSLNTMDEWVTNLTKVVETLKAKFPGVQRIELMTTLRSPMNMPCANDNDPNTVVPPYVDAAIQQVADASGGLVTVGPKIELTSCSWWAGGTDLTGAGNTGAGQLLATYYQTH